MLVVYWQWSGVREWRSAMTHCVTTTVANSGNFRQINQNLLSFPNFARLNLKKSVERISFFFSFFWLAFFAYYDAFMAWSERWKVKLRRLKCVRECSTLVCIEAVVVFLKTQIHDGNPYLLWFRLLSLLVQWWLSSIGLYLTSALLRPWIRQLKCRLLRLKVLRSRLEKACRQQNRSLER